MALQDIKNDVNPLTASNLPVKVWTAAKKKEARRIKDSTEKAERGFYMVVLASSKLIREYFVRRLIAWVQQLR